MLTTNEIDAEFESIVPANLREEFIHLSYAEMAERPECSEYADDLQRLENEWFIAESGDELADILSSVERANELRRNLDGIDTDERYRIAREAVHETGTQTDADEHAETLAVLKLL